MNRALLCVAAVLLLAGCPITCASTERYCDNTNNCICTRTECCAPPGKPCDFEGDCCGQAACVIPAQGGAKVCAGARRVSDGGECATVSLVCRENGDCCSNLCTNSWCACRANGELCEFSGDCCTASSCYYGRCGFPQPDGGFTN